MTNVEKFKEIFDIEVVPENTCLSESCLCHECSHHDGTRCHVEDWWYAEYQGEPTIPLSVIEKIKTGIRDEMTSDERKWGGIWYDKPRKTIIEIFDAIIDKAVKECTHENN